MSSMVSVSLSAVDQMEGSKERSRKRMWLFLFFISSLLALLHTSQIIFEYFRIRMSSSLNEKVTTDDYEYTLCLGNPVHIINNTETDTILLKLRGLDSSCNLTSPSLFCLSLLSERERHAIGYDVGKYFYDLPPYAGGPPQKSRIIIKRVFNNLYHGNCVTVREKRFMIVFLFNLEPEMKPQFVVHEEETLPVFKPEEAAEWFPVRDLYMLIGFKKTIYADNTWPYNSACSIDRPNVTGWNQFYDGGHEILSYKYSKKGCLDQCLYHLTLEYCRCIVPHSMIGENVNRTPICSRICNKIPQEKLDTMCHCKELCQNVEVTVHTFRTGLDQPGPQSKSMQMAGNLEDRKIAFGLVPFQYIGERKTYSLIKSFVSNVEYKQSQLKLDDLLSCIGGVWGLWIGLSCSVLLSIGLKALFKALPSTNEKLQRNLINIIYNSINFLGLMVIGSACVWQTYVTIDDYLKYNVVSIVTIEPQDSFPTVYVCSFPTIYIEAIDDVTLKENVILADKIATLKTLLGKNKFFTSSEFDNYYQNNFTREEKLLMVPKASDFLLECELVTELRSRLPCNYDSFLVLDGIMKKPSVCALIDPQKAGNSQKLKFKSLKMRVAAVRNHFVAGFKIQSRIGLHPFIAFEDREMSTEGFKNKFTVEPGDLAEATFTLTESQRLPDPYSSKCIPENSKYTTFHRGIFKHEFNFNYSYTYKECLYYCLVYRTFTSATSEKLAENCSCRLPCMEKEYELTAVNRNFFSKKKINLNLFDNARDFIDYIWNGTAEVHISRGSNTKKMIKEKPANDPFNLVGMLGGISGLWIGQSILSLIMEIQLMTSAIIEKLKKKLIKKI